MLGGSGGVLRSSRVAGTGRLAMGGICRTCDCVGQRCGCLSCEVIYMPLRSRLVGDCGDIVFVWCCSCKASVTILGWELLSLLPS